MLKRAIKFLITANVSSEHYKIAEDDMYNNNVMMLRVLSLIATSIFVVCTILGFFVPNMNSKMTVYVVGLILTVAILLSAIFSHNRKLHGFCMFVFDVMLLTVGLMITLVSAPQQLTVTYIPVSLLIPLFFDTKPYKFMTVVLSADLVYVILAPHIKPAEIITLDMVDVLAFSLAGVLIGTVMTKVKIERYVYAREIRRVAIYDGLTACYNRAAYENFLEENKSEIPEKFAAIMVDINGLKGVNDNQGHKAGDELIITVARAMKFVFEKYGKCYRLGGDEFVALIEAEQSKVEELIQSLRKMLKENDGEYVKEITVSVGFATPVDIETKDVEALISVADQRMYADKAVYYEKTGKTRRV